MGRDPINSITMQLLFIRYGYLNLQMTHYTMLSQLCMTIHVGSSVQGVLPTVLIKKLSKPALCSETGARSHVCGSNEEEKKNTCGGGIGLETQFIDHLYTHNSWLHFIDHWHKLVFLVYYSLH
jgi:hypothetical protein